MSNEPISNISFTILSLQQRSGAMKYQTQRIYKTAALIVCVPLYTLHAPIIPLCPALECLIFGSETGSFSLNKVSTKQLKTPSTSVFI